MATHASRERFRAAQGRGLDLFDHPALAPKPAPAGAVRCPCQLWPTVAAYFAHRDSGACPHNCPEGGARVHWLLKGRALSPAELERKAAARERLEAVKSNPIYQEHAAAKREARKAVAARIREGRNR